MQSCEARRRPSGPNDDPEGRHVRDVELVLEHQVVEFPRYRGQLGPLLEACSKASGLAPPEWLWRFSRLKPCPVTCRGCRRGPRSEPAKNTGQFTLRLLLQHPGALGAVIHRSERTRTEAATFQLCDVRRARRTAQASTRERLVASGQALSPD